MKTLQRAVIGILGLLLLVVVVQAFVPKSYVPETRDEVAEEACVGEPIVVDYAFGGGFMDPWACQVQCEDNNPRYILYSNGQATQCETPPGCNDLGEDRGVTCTVPEAQSQTAE